MAASKEVSCSWLLMRSHQCSRCSRFPVLASFLMRTATYGFWRNLLGLRVASDFAVGTATAGVLDAFRTLLLQRVDEFEGAIGEVLRPRRGRHGRAPGRASGGSGPSSEAAKTAAR